MYIIVLQIATFSRFSLLPELGQSRHRALRQEPIIYHTRMYYTILYYTILYHTIPYYTILYHTIPYYYKLYYSILYYTTL